MLMKRKNLLILLVLLMTAATGAWAQGAKHVITATYDKQTRSLEQPLPYETTVGALYEAVTGQPFSVLISGIFASEFPLTGISSDNTDVVSIGAFNGASTTVTVNADGPATVRLNFSGYVQGIYVNVVPPPFYVTMADGTEDAANWTAPVGTNSNAQTLPVGELSKGNAVTLTYGGHLKVKSVTATTDPEPDPLATPLTIEAITAGTIKVSITDEDDFPVTLTTGMKYSKDGGTTKTLITESRDIPVAKGDKVQFYGNGTDTQVYGNYPMVSILGSGDGFQTKVYGNIMSLLYETGFATKTELPDAENVFYELFAGNTTLIDASELLLPAETLTTGCYEYMFERCTNLTTAPKLPAETLATQCYEGMFHGCTSLTTAPKLPATTLATKCYSDMFFNCTSLTNAYVKAAYTKVTFPCSSMFHGCTATGATLHTTSGSKDSWQNVMGPNKDWETWTVADDWED